MLQIMRNIKLSIKGCSFCSFDNNIQHNYEITPDVYIYIYIYVYIYSMFVCNVNHLKSCKVSQDHQLQVVEEVPIFFS